jgi:hypothetical protein
VQRARRSRTYDVSALFSVNSGDEASNEVDDDDDDDDNAEIEQTLVRMLSERGAMTRRELQRAMSQLTRGACACMCLPASSVSRAMCAANRVNTVLATLVRARRVRAVAQPSFDGIGSIDALDDNNSSSNKAHDVFAAAGALHGVRGQPSISERVGAIDARQRDEARARRRDRALQDVRDARVQVCV